MNQLVLPRRVADILDEYDEKAAGAADAVRMLNDAVSAFKMSGTVAGTYVSPVLDRDPYVSADHVRNVLLQSAWKAIYDHLNIPVIASAKDRKQFDLALKTPPEFTIDNIRATFGDYVMKPRFHILKGLAECFTGLDPAYKSHSKVKIGVEGLPKRVIVSSFGGYGSWGRERLRDIVRSLATYRGQPIPTEEEYRKIDALHSYMTASSGQVDMDGSHFVTKGEDGEEIKGLDRGVTVRKFQNGNAHIIFDANARRDINMALAEFYGEVLPDAEEDERPARAASTAVSKDLQYYPTPKAVIDTILYDLWIKEGDKVLEPQCGCGRIMDAVRAKGARVVGIEVDPGRANEARMKGHSVMTGNFLEQPPRPVFDLVFMNPPFYGRHYLKHVRHALKFLKPGGRLVSILPASAHYDHGELKGRWTDLPVASFAESGTNVPTGYIIMSAE